MGVLWCELLLRTKCKAENLMITFCTRRYPQQFLAFADDVPFFFARQGSD